MIVFVIELILIFSINFFVCVVFYIVVIKFLIEMGLEGKMYGYGSIYVIFLLMNGEM